MRSSHSSQNGASARARRATAERGGPRRASCCRLDAVLPAVLLAVAIAVCSLLPWNLVALDRASRDLARMREELASHDARIERLRASCCEESREFQLDRFGLVRPDEAGSLVALPVDGSRP